MRCSDVSGSPVVSWKTFDERDGADDGRVELREVLARNPVLAMIAAAGLADLIAVDELSSDLKAQDMTAATGRHVPVARDLHRVVLGENRIEDRLFGQARRKRAHARRLDQGDFLRPDGAPQGDGVIRVRCHEVLASSGSLSPDTRRERRGKRPAHLQFLVEAESSHSRKELQRHPHHCLSSRGARDP